MTNPTDIPAFQSGFGEIDNNNLVVGQNAIIEDPNLVGNVDTQRGEVEKLDGLVKQLDGMVLPPELEQMKQAIKLDLQSASMSLQSNQPVGSALIVRIANEVNSASQAVIKEGAKETQAALNDILSSMVVSTALLQGHETGSAKEAAATFSLSAKAPDTFQVGKEEETAKEKFQQSITTKEADQFFTAAGGTIAGGLGFSGAIAGGIASEMKGLLGMGVTSDQKHYAGAFADANPGNIPGLGAGRSVGVQKNNGF